MRRLVSLLFILLFAVPAAAEPVHVTVTRQGDSFVAEFALPTHAQAWGFWRSSTAAADNRSWRLKSWQVLTPGVTLQRVGQQDAFVGTNGRTVPMNVRVRFAPFTGDLNGNYVPALRLGGESVALFDGHFALFSADLPTLASLPPGFDPAQSRIGDYGTAVEFRGRSLRIAGDTQGYLKGESSGAYGLFGVPRAVVANGIATVIDSELPQWIGDDLASFTPQVMGAMTARLGPSGANQPTVLAAWEGAGREGASMNGGTLKGLILMRFEGNAALQPLPALRNMARWFIAHESSHFWLGQAVDYESARDSWIMEGGADLLAVRTVSTLDPAFDRKKVLNEALADCSKLAAKPVATAIERNEPRANYACGAVFSLVAEQANGGDFYGFVKKLIDANRSDRTVNSSEWLAALDDVSGKPALSAGIRKLAEQGSAKPADDVAALLKAASIPYHIDAKGIPQL